MIDEAAAIPLPQVKALIGNYSVFMASTINGFVAQYLSVKGFGFAMTSFVY